jgi:hypothetical protein
MNKNKFIKFHSLEYEDDIEDMDDLEQMIAFTSNTKPSIRVPNLVRVEEIIRIRPCHIDSENLTEVHLLDGDILMADESYDLFEARFLGIMQTDFNKTFNTQEASQGGLFKCCLN